MGQFCLAKLLIKVVLRTSDLFEEARGYVKVLLNGKWGARGRSYSPTTDHTRLIQRHLEIGGDHNTQCAPGRGSPTWIAPFSRSTSGCAKGERRPFLPFSLPIGGSRALVHGQLWRRDGVLAVSCSQEGVIRVKPWVSESKL